MSLAEKGLCPRCWSRIPNEYRRVSLELIDELGKKFYEFNARCPSCGSSYGWASFMKLIEAFEPIRAFLFSVKEFEIVPDEVEYEVYGKKCFRIIFRSKNSRRSLVAYIDRGSFQVVEIRIQE